MALLCHMMEVDSRTCRDSSLMKAADNHMDRKMMTSHRTQVALVVVVVVVVVVGTSVLRQFHFSLCLICFAKKKKGIKLLFSFKIYFQNKNF